MINDREMNPRHVRMKETRSTFLVPLLGEGREPETRFKGAAAIKSPLNFRLLLTRPFSVLLHQFFARARASASSWTGRSDLYSPTNLSRRLMTPRFISRRVNRGWGLWTRFAAVKHRYLSVPRTEIDPSDTRDSRRERNSQCKSGWPEISLPGCAKSDVPNWLKSC